jgi:hypothetical protein
VRISPCGALGRARNPIQQSLCQQLTARSARERATQAPRANFLIALSLTGVKKFDEVAVWIAEEERAIAPGHRRWLLRGFADKGEDLALLILVKELLNRPKDQAMRVVLRATLDETRKPRP